MSRPYLVESGEPNPAIEDDRPVAALLTTIEVPAHGSYTVAVVLGQADDRRTAEAVIRKYQDVADAEDALEGTRRWWLNLTATVSMTAADGSFAPTTKTGALKVKLKRPKKK